MNHQMSDKPPSTAQNRHWGVFLLGAAAISAGCQATPPRYQSTWQRVTARCYVPVIPYCHGYTPTQWSRWPEECQPTDFVVVEEVPRPLQAPPAPPVPPLPAAEIFDSPSMPDPTDTREPRPPDRLIVPQGYLPATEQRGDDTLLTPPEKQSRGKPRADRDTSWTAHLQRYLSEVTRLR